MVCAVCNKESNNRRVCPYCFTPYPAEGGGQTAKARASTSTGRVSSAGVTPPAGAGLSLGPLAPLAAWFRQQSPIVRWSSAGIAVVALLWAFSGGGEAAPAAPAPVAAASTGPAMTREEAASLVKHTRETALVEEQNDEITVSYPAATFPVQPEGQVMLAMQFARADEVLVGRKRRIFFHGPSGRMFAQSDAVTGLTVVK